MLFKPSRAKALRFFPPVDVVFEDNHEEYGRVFFPLLSVDLTAVDRSLSGWLHLVYFNNDPYNEATVPYFTSYCGESSLGFDVMQGRYRLQTDLRYFDLTSEWEEPFEATRTTYSEAKAASDEQGQRFELDQVPLGGEPEWTQDDETPVDPSGEPMRFVTQYDTANSIGDGCDKVIYLFYSPTHKIAVQVAQTT